MQANDYSYNDFRAYSVYRAQNEPEEFIQNESDQSLSHSYNDFRDYIAHNWGNTPKMKEAEKKYNAEYYQKHKEEILAKRKEERSRNSYKVNEEG